MSDAQRIAYEITMVTPKRAHQLKRRRRLRRSTVAGVLALAVLAPSPLTAADDHPFHDAYCYVLSC